MSVRDVGVRVCRYSQLPVFFVLPGVPVYPCSYDELNPCSRGRFGDGLYFV